MVYGRCIVKRNEKAKGSESLIFHVETGVEGS